LGLGEPPTTLVQLKANSHHMLSTSKTLVCSNLDLEASNSMETNYNNQITSLMNFKFQSLETFCKLTMCKVLMILDFIVLHVDSSLCCDSRFTCGALCPTLVLFNELSSYFPCI
jgi:hypothetical protein